MNMLVITGSLLMLLSILSGWLIVAKRYLALGPVDRLVRDDMKLVKCHVEYPVMALILFAFYAINKNLPVYLVLPACVGAFTNPSLQFILSLVPDVDKRATAPFGVFSTISFIITSFGLGGMAVATVFEMIK
jgi:hypothetical protein